MLYLISLLFVPKFLQLNYSDFSVQMHSKLKLGKLENLEKNICWQFVSLRKPRHKCVQN